MYVLLLSGEVDELVGVIVRKSYEGSSALRKSRRLKVHCAG